MSNRLLAAARPNGRTALSSVVGRRRESVRRDDNSIAPETDIVVFSIIKPSACSECGAELCKGSFLKMEKQKPLCLECADLDHLVVLPRGDAALTRRSRKYSGLSAVIVKFSRSRRRYERQGLLVESHALERAQRECLDDEAQRLIARDRASLARERADRQYLEQFAERVRSQYPGCPPNEADAIARHACQKYSGRIGRTSAAKMFDTKAIELAVKADIRHTHTEYDRLLSKGWERTEARSAVASKAAEVLRRWG